MTLSTRDITAALRELAVAIQLPTPPPAVRARLNRAVETTDENTALLDFRDTAWSG